MGRDLCCRLCLFGGLFSLLGFSVFFGFSCSSLSSFFFFYFLFSFFILLIMDIDLVFLAKAVFEPFSFLILFFFFSLCCMLLLLCIRFHAKFLVLATQLGGIFVYGHVSVWGRVENLYVGAEVKSWNIV